MKYLILIVLTLVVLSSTLLLSLSTQALAQVNSFLTYTNTELGFTMKYPSDWTVDESDITNNKTVKFRSADSVGEIQVRIQNITLEGTGPTTDEVANYLTSHPVAGQKLLQVDKNGSFWSSCT